jgi:iron(III) transport system ATP-binding protein
MFVQLDQLCVRHAKAPQAAVDGVTLGLAPGQIGVLIGPSGCGKTTLLRAIAGLQPIESGHIALDGQSVSAAGIHLPPEARRVGMVFQDFALFPHLDVRDNIAFGLRYGAAKDRTLSRTQIDQTVTQQLDLVGLSGAGARFPHELSGGQQQRVALARALALKPRLLLLDEPFSSLDVDLRERLAHEVRGILKAAHATALMVTHDQLEAFAMGDVIGVMAEGKLHQWADAYALYHRPATRFVADFIGHGVFMPARIELHREDGAAHKHVVTPLGELHDIAPELINNLPAGDTELLLRADDIVHDDASPVQARIVRKMFRGNEFLYTLELASGETVLAHVPSHHDHAVGELIGIRAEVDHVVTFGKG